MSITPDYYNLVELGESDLPMDFIYNSICQIIANNINATNVSLLLYVGRYDSLVVGGNYINTDVIKQIKRNQIVLTEKFQDILSHVSYYEFVRFCITKLGKRPDVNNITKQDSDEFKKFCKDICYELRFKPQENPLQSIKQNLVTAIEQYQDYKKYRSKLIGNIVRFSEKKTTSSNDQNPTDKEKALYDKDRASYSKFLDYFRSSQPPPPMILDSSHDPSKMPYTQMLTDNEMNIRIADSFIYDELAYFSLIYKGRLFGMLRITINKSFVDSNIRTTDSFFGEEFNRKAIRIISNLIGKQFYFSKISNIAINNIIKKGGNPKRDANQFCRAMNEIVNARGCILRLKDDSPFEFNIVGRSQDLDGYIKDYNDNQFFKNSSSTLSKILSIEKNRPGIRVVALKIETEEVSEKNGTKKYKIKHHKYYYKDNGENIITTSDLADIKTEAARIDINLLFGDNTDRVLKLYADHGLFEILYFPLFIEKDEVGYLTFANTSYRFFTDEDVNTLSPIVQAVDMELAVKKVLDFEKFHTLFLKSWGHELLTPAKALYQDAQNTAYSHDEFEKLRNSVLNTISHIFLHLKQIALVTPRTSVTNPDYLVIPFLRECAKDIENALTYLENIKSRGYEGQPRKIVIDFEHDATLDCFSLKYLSVIEVVLWQFASNARKYSYNEKMPPPVDLCYNYKEILKIEIHAKLINGNILEVSLSNYGYFDANFKDEVWDENFRTEGAEKFASGSGNGLYICSLLAEKIGSKNIGYDVEYSELECKTTFKILIGCTDI